MSLTIFFKFYSYNLYKVLHFLFTIFHHSYIIGILLARMLNVAPQRIGALKKGRTKCALQLWLLAAFILQVTSQMIDILIHITATRTIHSNSRRYRRSRVVRLLMIRINLNRCTHIENGVFSVNCSGGRRCCWWRRFHYNRWCIVGRT